jgi:hypothetical protein
MKWGTRGSDALAHLRELALAQEQGTPHALLTGAASPDRLVYLSSLAGTVGCSRPESGQA